MTTAPYRGFRFPKPIIQHAVWRACQVDEDGSQDLLSHSAVSGGQARGLLPGDERFIPEQPMRRGGDQMAAGSEGISDGSVDGEKALGGALSR